MASFICDSLYFIMWKTAWEMQNTGLVNYGIHNILKCE